MLVFDDVTGDAHSQAGALTNGFSGEEILEEMLFHLVRHTFTIIGNGDDERITTGRHVDNDLWLII